MSDTSQGEGWWQASDGKWYAPEQHPDNRPSPPQFARPDPEYGAQHYGGPVYDATPGMIMGIIGFVLGSFFLHIPALVMGMRGRKAPQNRNAGAAFWLGVIGLIWDCITGFIFLTNLSDNGLNEASAMLAALVFG